LVGLGELMKVQGEQENADRILFLSQLLTEEMQEHRLMMQAEQGKLSLKETTHPISFVLNQLGRLFEHHAATSSCRVQFETPSVDEMLKCDHRLLNRVLINMIKNALEASPPGGVVRVWSEFQADCPTFIVKNVGVIPDEIRLQIFRRSFSTKDEHGRGLGTYSMKLFGEQYLGGTVSFTTNAETGTCFKLVLPASSVLSHGAD